MLTKASGYWNGSLTREHLNAVSEYLEGESDLSTCYFSRFPSINFTLALEYLGVAKVSCILHHWDAQLIIAYSWARPAILVAGKGRG